MPGPDAAAPRVLADAAEKLLARETGDGGGSAEGPPSCGPATVRACQKLCGHLERLVGRHGAAALFARSVAFTRDHYPWLDLTPVGPRSDDPWPALLARLESADRDEARQASLSLLTSFVELLGRLIGDALVVVLLSEIWPEDFPLAAPSAPTEETP